MIIKQFRIPDETWDKLAKRHKTDDQVLEDIVLRLKKFENTSINEKMLVLTGPERAQLEEMLQVTINSVADLIKEVKHLTTIKIEGVEVAMEPELLAQLKDQADFYGRTPAEYLTELVQQNLMQLIRGN